MDDRSHDHSHENALEAELDDDLLDEALLDDDRLAEPADSNLRTLIVVLAAGAGNRYSGDTHKLEAMIGDRTVAEHAIVAAVASGVGDVIVITGASQPSPATMSALARATSGRANTNAEIDTSGIDTASAPFEPAGVRPPNTGFDASATESATETVQFIHNDDWADGQATSLQVALEEASRVGVDAVVVGLADQPGVTPEAWRRVAASQSPIAVATYDGNRGNPVRLHHTIWPLLPSTGDEGARSVMRLHPELVEQIPCPGSAHDIDTREDLQLWQSRSSTSSP